jgi:hypothetical protein
MFPGTVTRHQHTRFVLNCYLFTLRLNYSNCHLKPEKGINPSGSIKASLGTNKSIEIDWMVPTISWMHRLQFRCLDTSLWIRHFIVGRELFVSSKEMFERAIQHDLVSRRTFAIVNEIWWRAIRGKRLPFRIEKCSDWMSGVHGWSCSEFRLTQGEAVNYRNCYSIYSWVH